MSRTSIFSSNMTMIFFVIFLIANVTLMCLCKILFINFSRFRRFVEHATCRIAAIFDRVQHLFHKLVNCIFSSARLHWFGVLIIIATNSFVTKFISLDKILYTIYYHLVCKIEQFQLWLRNQHTWQMVFASVCCNSGILRMIFSPCNGILIACSPSITMQSYLCLLRTILTRNTVGSTSRNVFHVHVSFD